MRKAWFPQMLCSAFLMLAKARHHFTHPPAWLSRAREAGGSGGEHHHQQLLAARLYESLSALDLVVEAAILIQLCLFRLELVSAGRARAALMRFMVMSLVISIAAFAVTVSVVGSAEAAAVFLMALPNAAAVVQFALEKLKRVLGKVE
jgi:hypothetical protein